MLPDKRFFLLVALGALFFGPVSASEVTGAVGPVDAGAGESEAQVSVSPKQIELEFAPAPEGWQRDIAWQVFGFSGNATPPQFFYRIPADPDEAKALIETISASPLVGRVQLLNAVIAEAPGETSSAGPIVTDVNASWDVRWEGMGRSAPWISKADSAGVLQDLIEVSAMSSVVHDPDEGDQSASNGLSGKAPLAKSDLVLGINVPIASMEKHSVGRGTLKAVRSR